MKKKFLLTASTAILALGVLTACGDKKEETEKQDPAPTEQQDANNETDSGAEDNGDAQTDDADGEDAAGDAEETEEEAK